MPIKPRNEFTLAPIIRLAGDRVDRRLEQHRYWLRWNGELTRERPLLPWSKSECFIVVADEPHEPVGMSFEVNLPVPGTLWMVGITGVVTFVCPQSDVHRLVTRWMQARELKDPDAAFREDLSSALETAAASCTERAIAEADGVLGGGAMGDELSKSLARTWGLRCRLRFELKGKEALKRTEVSVQARVRLVDYEDGIPVTALVELLPDLKPSSRIRALAALGRTHELGARFAEDARAFYSAEVGVDQLSDPVEQQAYRRKLEGRIKETAGSFGFDARIVKLVASAPSIPGDTDELVGVKLTDFQLRGEEPVEISLTAKLRLVRRSDLMRAMASKPGVPFNTEFERIARSILGSVAVGWSAEDLRQDRRSAIEEELRTALGSWAEGYGYEIVDCPITTTIDSALPPRQTVTLWDGPVLSDERGVTVDVEVVAELRYRVGVRAGQSTQTLLEPVTGNTGRIVAAIIGSHKPSEIYRYWTVPLPDGRPPLQEELRKKIIELLKTHTDEPAVTLRLRGQVEFVRIYEMILRSSIESRGIQLQPDNVPGELTVDINAPAVGLPERAWAEMATRRMISGESWNPLSLVSEVLPHLLRSSFAEVLEARKGKQLSKRETTELLGQKVANKILERFAIKVRPEIRFHAAPDIMESYRRMARERHDVLTHYFDMRNKLLKSIAQKEEERIGVTQLLPK